MGAPHFHLRRAWPCKDEETGLTTSNQTQALLKAGILPPDSEKKISKKNNPKMTFDKMCREKWIFIARSHGLEIEDTPKPRDEVGKTLEEFQKDKDKQRNLVYTLLSALTEKNIDVLEEISKWEELMPSIQNFREWTKERCRDAQNTYRDGQLDPIVDLFVAAFANSNKAIKDGYDSQIKQYDHMLNGYTKETANGKKHFFGAAEISQVFESATPELLRKIAASGNVRQCFNFTKASLKCHLLS